MIGEDERYRRALTYIVHLPKAVVTEAEQQRQRRDRNLGTSRLQPPYDDWSLIRRFWVFQNERAPLLVLALLAVALTVAVGHLHSNLRWPTVTVASTVVVLYLLQIRLADEPKDFEHDHLHYPNRPVQRGLITLAELETIKNVVIVLFFGLAATSASWSVMLWAVILQGYSYLTRREFFIRDWLRDHFLTYQLIHYVQLLILCWLVLGVLEIAPLIERGLYFVYVMLMIGMLESSRTIGGSDQQAAGDRYSHRLGVELAVGVFVVFVLATASVAVLLLLRQDQAVLWPLLAAGLSIIGGAAYLYCRKPVTRRAEAMHVAALLMYLCAAGALIFG